MQSTFHVAALFKAGPGCSEQLGLRLMALASLSQQETGSLKYEVLQGIEDTDVWFVFEEWIDRSAFEAHMEKPYVRDFLKVARELCPDEPSLDFFRCLTC